MPPFRRKLTAFVVSVTYLALPASTHGQETAAPITAAQPAIPGSAAGRELAAWLAAFNASDQAALEALLARVVRSAVPPMETLLDLRRRSGGFDVFKIEEAAGQR